MTYHIVKKGDCITSLAEEYGLLPDQIWNDSQNSTLREQRKDPNLLLDRDRVFIPEKKLRVESSSTEQRHRFRVRSGKTILRLRLLVDGEPIDNMNYVLEVAPQKYQGSTDTEGKLEQQIKANAKHALLFLEGWLDPIHLDVGALDPLDSVTGLQQRLTILGNHVV